MSHRRIYLIVDPGYGPQLAAPPADAAVWVVGSPANTPVARRLWQECRPAGPRAGITTFVATADAPAQQLLNILLTVEEHEGAGGAGGGYAAWEVIGCAPEAEIEQELAGLFLRVAESTENGFVARIDRPTCGY